MNQREKFNRMIKNVIHTEIEKEIRDKEYAESHRDRMDKSLFDKGQAWCNEGLSIDDAPEEIRNNSNFIKGFQRAARIKMINEDLYNQGVEAFKNNVNLAGIRSEILSNEHFIRGYDDARRNIEPKR